MGPKSIGDDMSTTPTAVRDLTSEEQQHLMNDGWAQLQARLHPAKLKGSCAARIFQHTRLSGDFADVQTRIRLAVFVDYQAAVTIIADSLYRTVRELLYEKNALEWQVEPKAVQQRRQLELENKGLGAVEKEWSVQEVARRDSDAASKAQAERAHQRAVKDIEIAISGLVLQGFGRIDQAAMDAARRELRAYVAQNLGKKNGVDVLGWVTAKIAWLHRDNEKRQEKWNSR
jgi:hypothetical protein